LLYYNLTLRCLYSLIYDGLNVLMVNDFKDYVSPYSYRYGTPEMRGIWSEVNKRKIWRKIWVALAEVQAEFGLATPEQVADLRAHVGKIDLDRAFEIESSIHHDLMAEVKTYTEQCPTGGGIIHLGATSVDVKDNTIALQLRASLDWIINNLINLLLVLAAKVKHYADTPLIAFTHLQPAEPSTLGYRLALYAQDLFADWQNLRRLRNDLRGKGFKGAVGTGASYADLIGKEKLQRFEDRLSELLDLPFFEVTSQTYPRKQEYEILVGLAGVGASLYKFAFDLRYLQSPPIGECGEPFGNEQVGSSAMPFKRNPIAAEKVDSLARLLAQFPRVAWDNAAHSLLERTMDDSANRRTILPEAFLIVDELLRTVHRIFDGLRVNQASMARNLAIYGPFAATERVLMALSKAGANRQTMHERLRQHALTAWEAVGAGEPNPLAERIIKDDAFLGYLSSFELSALMDVTDYLGNAPERARTLAERIVKGLS
jgi:adenylosuccinate lyase